ncbi:MAG: hypothetical protein ACJ71U_15125 [Terriglobales bacterium]
MALLCFSVSLLTAQTAPAASSQNPAAPVQAAEKPSISLSPAVVMAKGNFSQTLSQTLTLTNQTARDFAFEMVAEDVVVKDGKRIFVTAGETPNSIAASAVFTQKTVLVKPFSSASVDVRLTLPAETNIRAVVAMFRGTDKLPTSSGAVGMTASLGSLITFNLTDNVKLKPEPVRVVPASETANMKIAQWISNSGTEPVLPEGAAAVLSSSGALVGKAVFDPQRLLPGERLEFSAEYPGELPSGKYRALCSFQFEGKTQTTEAAFEIPKTDVPSK